MTGLAAGHDLCILSINPVVGWIDEFVSPHDLAQIEAALAQVTTQPALITSEDGPVVDEKRVAQSYRIPGGSIPVVDSVLKQIAALLNLKPAQCESPELISYDAGGEFKLHFDGALSGVMPEYAGTNCPPSQRIFTAVLYLNEDFTGGTTEFPRLDVEIQPKKGRVLFWQNTKPGTTNVHPFSMHQGCPVFEGNKRIISFWFRDRPHLPAEGRSDS
ncbi:prolyl hydroxylase family protein [Pseudooctadecabacter sp.]|uniref:prolyl hydroxylase family protein n=1 Tax=Pseudooctadecabacter sp. TaxID=1966338 RepID=UPI0025F8ED08|nr:2OG-Fe(II) oxygenase [Pseudooctadecabacter sp.]